MIDQIDLISGQLKDAVYDAEGWTSALDTINAFINGSGAVLLSVEERLRHAPSSGDLVEMNRDYFDNGWYANDGREACVPWLRANGIVRDYDVLDMSRIDQFHEDFLARHDRKWFAGVGANLTGDMWCLSLQRSSSKGPFLESDMPRLGALRLRLEEAATLARIVSRHWLDGAVSAFESDKVAALVTDRAGRILHMNRPARSIVLGPNDVRPRSGLLSFTPFPATSTRAFEDILRSKIFASPPSAWLSTRVAVEYEEKAYMLEATSLLGQANLVFSKASFLVRIHPRWPVPEEILKTRYRLTPSEARVAMALSAGLDVEEMAGLFKVSPNTIRVQLKMAFAKTETGSQAKLVSFISQLGRP